MLGVVEALRRGGPVGHPQPPVELLAEADR